MCNTVTSILLLLLIGVAAGQDLVVQTTDVLVPALVKDSKGKLVFGLHAEDFLIEDDGVEQTVKLDETQALEPVSLVAAVQTGRTAFRELDQMQGLGAMLGPVFAQLGTQIAIVTFDSHVTLLRDFTDNEQLVRGDLKKVRPGDGGAVTLDAVIYSLKMLAAVPENHLRVLLLISETRDHGSAVNIADIIALAGSNKNTLVYTLAFSPAVSEVLDINRQANGPDLLAPILMASQAMRKNVPKAIASMTGGEYGLFRSRAGFEDRLQDFDNHLRNRYLLSFEPKAPHSGLHNIRVKLRGHRGATVLARNSYWIAQKVSPSH
jgi:VWFA-related protein